MKVKVIKNYTDSSSGELKRVGDEFEVKENRGKVLINAGVAKEVGATAKPAKEPIAELLVEETTTKEVKVSKSKK